MQALANHLQTILDNVHAHLSPETLGAWHDKPAPEKWSKAEELGHLVDSAVNNLSRFVRGTYESDFALIYAQHEWVQAQHYREAPLEDVAALWLLLNRQLVRVLRHYPADRLTARCDVSKNGVVQVQTIEFLAHDYVAHLQHHLRQLGLPAGADFVADLLSPIGKK